MVAGGCCDNNFVVRVMYARSAGNTFYMCHMYMCHICHKNQRSANEAGECAAVCYFSVLLILKQQQLHWKQAKEKFKFY